MTAGAMTGGESSDGGAGAGGGATPTFGSPGGFGGAVDSGDVAGADGIAAVTGIGTGGAGAGSACLSGVDRAAAVFVETAAIPSIRGGHVGIGTVDSPALGASIWPLTCETARGRTVGADSGAFTATGPDVGFAGTGAFGGSSAQAVMPPIPAASRHAIVRQLARVIHPPFGSVRSPGPYRDLPVLSARTIGIPNRNSGRPDNPGKASKKWSDRLLTSDL